MSEKKNIPEEQSANNNQYSAEKNENISEENIQPSTFNIQHHKEMEIHHSHHPSHKKKWTHYLWEFLMLFLAVFCGFLAENFREHQVERQREKEYMQSLAEDLRGDTMSIQKYMRLAKAAQLKIDTMVLYVKYHSSAQTADFSLIELNINALPWFNFIRINRTESQLKNAGNMRLIHNNNVANDLIEYWATGEQTINAQLRYEAYRSNAREIRQRPFSKRCGGYYFYC
jgi:hypothetical protein